jgi:hypothetical protein
LLVVKRHDERDDEQSTSALTSDRRRAIDERDTRPSSLLSLASIARVQRPLRKERDNERDDERDDDKGDNERSRDDDDECDDKRSTTRATTAA